MRIIQKLTVRVLAGVISIVSIASISIFPVTADESVKLNVVSSGIDSNAELYAESVVDQYVETFYGIAQEEDIFMDTSKPYYLGTGFYAYRYENQQLVQNNDIIYFPVIQSDKVIFILSVFPDNDGYSAAAGAEFSDLMNSTSETFMVVYIGDSSNEEGYFITDNSVTLFYDADPNSQQTLPENISPSQINDPEQNLMSDSYQIGIVDYPTSGIMMAANVEGFSRYEENYKILEMSNCFLGQGNYGLCWAASAGTIIRYKTGNRTVTAMAIADRLGIGYDDGGTLNEAYTALSLYGASTSYSKVARPASSTTEIRHNINNRFPIYMVGTMYSDVVERHAVVGIGYNNNLLLYYNPANEKMAATQYNGTSTTFSTGSHVYYWKKSIMATL